MLLNLVPQFLSRQADFDVVKIFHQSELCLIKFSEAQIAFVGQ